MNHVITNVVNVNLLCVDFAIHIVFRINLKKKNRKTIIRLMIIN